MGYFLQKFLLIVLALQYAIQMQNFKLDLAFPGCVVKCKGWGSILQCDVVKGDAMDIELVNEHDPLAEMAESTENLEVRRCGRTACCNGSRCMLQRAALCSFTIRATNSNLWRPLAPLLRVIENCVRGVFCRKFHSKQVLFEAIFYILVFLVAFSHKVNVHSHSNALTYLKNGNLWRPLAPLQRETETFVH